MTRPVMPKRSEKAFMAVVVELAQSLGWLAYHTFDSRRSQPGFPDLVLCKPPRLIFAELKARQGRLALAQLRWLDALAGVVGVEVHQWTDNGDVRPIADVLLGRAA